MKNNKGFTIVELMVVVAILGLLSAIAVISVTRYRDNAVEKEKISLRQNVISTFNMYRIDYGIGVDTEVDISKFVSEFDAIFNFNGERCTEVGGTIKAIEEGMVETTDEKGNKVSIYSHREVYCVEMTCNGIKVIDDYSQEDSLCKTN